MADLTYNPRVFETPDMEAARQIILTPVTGGQGTDERWVRETPYLTGLVAEKLQLGPDSLVLDYGCGVGRMAKALIETTGCAVLGVDASVEMRGLAPGYVASPRFSVVSRNVLQSMTRHGLRVDAAISVWVLQHCVKPREDIDLIRRVMAPRAPLAVINTVVRALPTVEKGWVSDGLDMRELLAEKFEPADEGRLDPAVVGEKMEQATFWGLYRAAG